VETLPGISGKAGSVGVLGLRELVPTIPGDNPAMVNGPKAYNRPAGEQGNAQRHHRPILSRVVQAGCRLIPVQTPPTDGELSWRRAGAFNVISGADFVQGR